MKRLRLLTARRSARWDAGRFVVEGPKLISEALAAGYPLEDVYLDAGRDGESYRELAEEGRRHGASVHEVEPAALSRALDSVTPQPIAAVAPMAEHSLPDVLADPGPGRQPLTIVCVGLQDPGNAGTVIRSAAASGAGAVVLCTGGVDLYNPKTLRATAGALFSLPVVTAIDALEAIDVVADAGSSVYGTLAAGGQSPDAADLTSPCALVLGSEARGLPDAVRRRIGGHLTIPMHPASESLNVAMAATVLCFEAARQQRARIAA